MLETELDALLTECRDLHNALYPSNAITDQDWPAFKSEWALWPLFVLQGRVELYRQLVKK